MARVFILACATLLAAPLFAQPTPSCPGDCNLDGVVAINELLIGVNFFLADQAPAGCDELDDNVDGAVQVNELVLAVSKALGECRLSEEDAAEAASQAVVGTTDAFDVLDLGSAVAGGGGAGGPGIAGGAPVCPEGGSRDESCTLRSGASRLAVIFDDCRVRTGTITVSVDGRVTRTVDDPEFCDTRAIADGVEITDQLTDFRQTIVREDESGVAFFELTGTYERRLVFGGSSCDGRNRSEAFDGGLAFRCTTDVVGDVEGCPLAGRDLGLVLRDLTIVRDAEGELGDCTPTKTLTGRLEMADRISGQSFAAVYRQLFATQRLRNGEFDTVLQGGLALDCLGEFSIQTEVPLRRAPTARCPRVGLLFTRLPDGLERAVRYIGGGVEVDLDGDGTGDRKFEDCADPTLAQCR